MKGSNLMTDKGNQTMPGFSGGNYSQKDLNGIAAFVMTHFTEGNPSEHVFSEFANKPG